MKEKVASKTWKTEKVITEYEILFGFSGDDTRSTVGGTQLNEPCFETESARQKISGTAYMCEPDLIFHKCSEPVRTQANNVLSLAKSLAAV